MSGFFFQRKVIARRLHVDHGAGAQLFMHEAGAATALRVPLHTDLVLPLVPAAFEQRVLADQSVGKVQPDVGPWLAGRQDGTHRRSEGIEQGVAGQVLDRFQAQLQQGASGVGLVVHGLSPVTAVTVWRGGCLPAPGVRCRPGRDRLLRR
ncbi:hypothetical protein D3C72_1904890 [compost metagenome]